MSWIRCVQCAALGFNLAVPALSHAAELAPIDVTPETRLVTLGAAATQITFALGLGSNVVAVDQSSVVPAEATQRPQAGYIRAISAEGVLAMQPDLIVATSDLGPPDAAQQLKTAGVPIVVIPAPDDVPQIEDAARALGRLFKRDADAERQIQRMHQELDAVPPAPEPRPRVAFLMQTPGHSGALSAAGRGTRADTLIGWAGGSNVLASFEGYKPVTTEALLEADPDVLLIGWHGSEPDTSAADPAATLASRPGWSSVRAVASHRVHRIPLGASLTFGTQLGESVSQIAALLQPGPEPKPHDP